MTEFPETQTSLLESIQSLDDREAWEKFVKLYRPIIYRIARRKGFQQSDAEDLSQRVLAAIAASIHRWKKHDPNVRFRHWLRRVVKNAIINAATRRRPEVPVSGLSNQEILSEPIADNETENTIELEYRRQLFKRAAATIKSDIETSTWEAFELTVIEELSIEMAAHKLGKSIGSVYAARSRVMRRLIHRASKQRFRRPSKRLQVALHQVNFLIGLAGLAFMKSLGLSDRALPASSSKRSTHHLIESSRSKSCLPALTNSGTARKRFEREAKAAAAVLHPNVIPIHGVFNNTGAVLLGHGLRGW